MVRNVTTATLTPFLPDAAKANGTAVIVAPGGGFRWLSINNEGWENRAGPQRARHRRLRAQVPPAADPADTRGSQRIDEPDLRAPGAPAPLPVPRRPKAPRPPRSRT